MRRFVPLACVPAALLAAGCATLNRPLPPAPSAFTGFHADVAPFDQGGECIVQPHTGDGRVLAAYYPTRDEPRSVVTLIYDDHGQLRQAHEARGVVAVHFRGPAPSPRAVDSAVAAARDTMRMTFVSFDYRTHRASAENRGAGRGRQRVTGELIDADTATALGQPGERVRRAASRCGMNMQAQR